MLNDFFDQFKPYAKAYQAYCEHGVDRTLNPDDTEMSGHEPWRMTHYFEVGADALRIIVSALAAAGRPIPRRILDFPSGSGRVTRHLRAFFADAEIWACDIKDYHREFCERQFRATPIASVGNLRNLRFDADFDLIFCGSLLTHVPQDQAEAALIAIANALTPRGIAIVTFHGRHADYIQKNKWKYVDDELFAVAGARVREAGYGFVGYRPSAQGRGSDSEPDYGVALTRPSWVTAQLETQANSRILGFTERAWDDHQDVVVFGRPGVND